MRLALVLASLSLVLLACSKDQPPPSASAPPAPTAAGGPVSVTGQPVTAPDEARKLAAGGAPILDVRTQEEWNDGHLDQAKLVPVQELAARMGEVEAMLGGDKSKPLVVVCRSGSRAQKAKAMLAAAGFGNVVNGGRWENLK